MLTILILLYLNKHYSIAGGGENKPEETTVECNRSIVIMSLNYPK